MMLFMTAQHTAFLYNHSLPSTSFHLSFEKRSSSFFSTQISGDPTIISPYKTATTNTTNITTTQAFSFIFPTFPSSSPLSSTKSPHYHLRRHALPQTTRLHLSSPSASSSSPPAVSNDDDMTSPESQALIKACQILDLDTIRALLDAHPGLISRASDAEQGKSGWTPLQWACREGGRLGTSYQAGCMKMTGAEERTLNEAVVRLLMERCDRKYGGKGVYAELCRANAFGSSPLHAAAHWGNPQAIVAILDALYTQIDTLDIQEFKLKHPELVAGKTDEEIRDIMRENVVECPNKYMWTPLHWAGKGGHADCVRLLIEEGNANTAAKHIFGSIPLHEAVNSTSVETVTAMLTCKPKHSSSSSFSSSSSNADFVNTQSNDGETPLLGAAYLGFDEITRVLLAANAAIDICDAEGNSPLIRAARAGHEDVIALLLMAAENQRGGGDRNAQPFQDYVNMQNAAGETALHEAARWGRLEAMFELTKAGADTRITENTGKTPLHMAAIYGRDWDDSEGAQWLIEEANADKLAKDHDGATPRDIAIKDKTEEEIQESELVALLS